MTNVLVLYNSPTLPASHPDAEAEKDILHTVEDVSRILKGSGFGVTLLGVSRDPQPLVRVLADEPPRVVFNLFEGTGERNQTEAYAIGLLEWSGVPYTGCPLPAAVLARDKPLTKRICKGAGLPTGEFFVVDKHPLQQLPKQWPVFVKLATEDASVGIDNGSVVKDEAALLDRIAWLVERYDAPVMVEQYLPGQEFNVGVAELPATTALPVSEIIFDRSNPQHWPIVTYESKWSPGSAADLAALPRCPAEISRTLAEELQRLALSAFGLLGCRDYARIDFRLDAAGAPQILEVNPNPDFSSGAGFARALRAAGVTYEAFVVQLVQNALARHPSGRRV